VLRRDTGTREHRATGAKGSMVTGATGALVAKGDNGDPELQ